MNKGELVKFLESYTDDTEICVIVRDRVPDFNNLTTVRPIAAAHGYMWPRNRIEHEVWLQLK